MEKLVEEKVGESWQDITSAFNIVYTNDLKK